MVWIKALHIISLVAWFGGLFYLPRLYVYHAECQDQIGNNRFKIMEKKLYYYIMTPAAVLTILFGTALLHVSFKGYLNQPWMQWKLVLVVFLIAYHIYLGRILKRFRQDNNQHSAKFYRWINEVPTVLLILIVVLVVVKPQ